jgi:hypothetical protein
MLSVGLELHVGGKQKACKVAGGTSFGQYVGLELQDVPATGHV